MRRVGPVSWSSDEILDKLLNELSAPLSSDDGTVALTRLAAAVPCSL